MASGVGRGCRIRPPQAEQGCTGGANVLGVVCRALTHDPERWGDEWVACGKLKGDAGLPEPTKQLILLMAWLVVCRIQSTSVYYIGISATVSGHSLHRRWAERSGSLNYERQNVCCSFFQKRRRTETVTARTCI